MPPPPSAALSVSGALTLVAPIRVTDDGAIEAPQELEYEAAELIEFEEDETLEY